jgi:ABC-2 type transport system permease protein
VHAATSLTGTRALVRFALRRDRVRIVVWIAAIVVLVLVTASSVKGLYPTPQSLRDAAALVEGNPAAIAFNGPVQGIDTIGGRVAFEAGSTTLVIVALMSLFMTTHLTRADEEAGRLELVRATVVGRHAPLAAAVVVVGAMNVVTGALVGAGLVAEGLPVTGSVVFGLHLAVLGVVFGAIASVAAQVTEVARVASGLTGAVLGVAFALRAAGDMGDGTLSWASPIGWVQKARPYANERWWPLLVAGGAAAAIQALAVRLSMRRDAGAGLLASRSGPASASPALGRPLGLALRLQRASLLWWGIGVLALGLVYGSVADQIDEFVQDNEAMRDFVARSGGASLTDSFLGTTLLILALIAAGFAVQSVLRLRSEETALRAEPVLVAGASRRTWAGSHLAVAMAGSTLVVVLGGCGLGLAYGLIIGDLGQVPRLAAASLVQVPAVWVLIGSSFALVGLAPRASAAAWGSVFVCFVVGFLGEVLRLPRWLRDVSPFEHAPLVPAEHLSVMPLVVTALVAAALLAAGAVGLRRRDIV